MDPRLRGDDGFGGLSQRLRKRQIVVRQFRLIVRLPFFPLPLAPCAFGQDDQQQFLPVLQQILEPQHAIALVRAQIALRQQAAQPPPAITRLGIGDDVGRAVGEDQAGAGHKFEVLRQIHPDHVAAALARILERLPHAHHARDRVAIGDAEAGMAELDRAGEQIGAVARPVQEGEIARRRQLDISEGLFVDAHTNSPWIYQPASPSPRSSRPWRNSQKRCPASSSTRK